MIDPYIVILDNCALPRLAAQGSAELAWAVRAASLGAIVIRIPYYLVDLEVVSVARTDPAECRRRLEILLQLSLDRPHRISNNLRNRVRHEIGEVAAGRPASPVFTSEDKRLRQLLDHGVAERDLAVADELRAENEHDGDVFAQSVRFARSQHGALAIEDDCEAHFTSTASARALIAEVCTDSILGPSPALLGLHSERSRWPSPDAIPTLWNWVAWEAFRMYRHHAETGWKDRIKRLYPADTFYFVDSAHAHVLVTDDRGLRNRARTLVASGLVDRPCHVFDPAQFIDWCHTFVEGAFVRRGSAVALPSAHLLREIEAEAAGRSVFGA